MGLENPRTARAARPLYEHFAVKTAFIKPVKSQGGRIMSEIIHSGDCVH